MVTTASPGPAASGEPLPPEATVTGTPLQPPEYVVYML